MKEHDIFEYKSWSISEQYFNLQHINKVESLFTQGNGYLCTRASFEEAYCNERRGAFINGTFNTVQGDNEVSELPNFADVLNAEIYINEDRYNLESGKVLHYSRELNLRNGELVRHIEWLSPNGVVLNMEFKRFVSLADKHLIVSEIKLRASENVKVTIIRKVDGKISNNGAQHFVEGNMKFIEKKIAHLNQKTSKSHINFQINMISKMFINLEDVESFPELNIGRRDLQYIHKLELGKNKECTMLTYAHISTDIDEDLCKEQRRDAVQQIKQYQEETYRDLLRASEQQWNAFWDQSDVKIETKNPFIQTAVRFALYHLRIMTPTESSYCGIGAKGLSGEDYKGHSFWDTEIYLLPFWTMTNPEVAKNLLHYRYNLLNSAQEKAKENGYQGAMYPWETASIADGECTPEWGNIDVITGEREPIWTGRKQIHITADIVYALWKYYLMTNNVEFMQRFGFTMIIETAKFWLSRLEYNNKQNRYEITDVIGPDEYKEHVDNNAYTNYMCYWNLKLAHQIITEYGLEEKAGTELLNEIAKKLDQIYLPKPNEKGLIAQDETYLNLKDLPDFDKYKQAEKVLTIFEEYSMTQLKDFQVSKQADMVILLLLMNNYFDKEILKKNFYYYESKTLHDSSLSLSMHAIAAAFLQDKKLAYRFFEKACHVDLNQNAQSSKTGIHAAAMGGIWQAIVMGFCGFTYYENVFGFHPCLPEDIYNIRYKIMYHGELFDVQLNHQTIKISCLNESRTRRCRVKINGVDYDFTNDIEVRWG